MSEATSIPRSPTPGKDPPPLSTETQDQDPPSIPETDPQSSNKNDMPPPPKPHRRTKPPSVPQILTTHPSSMSGSRYPSLSRTQYQSQTQSHLETQQLDVYRPPFSPFFTLINDSGPGGGGKREGGSTIHPRKIHYIFSDDDTSELLTSSLIHSLNPLSNSAVESPSASRELSSSQRESSSSSSATFRKERKGKEKAPKEPKAKIEKEERVIIVDINETGDGVKSVSSLSSTWQVLGAEIGKAPTFDGDSDPSTRGDEQERGLMLRIEGVGVSALVNEDEEPKKEGSGVLGEEEISVLLEGFDRKMGVLRRIISSRASKEDLEGAEEAEGEVGGDGIQEGGEGEMEARRESAGSTEEREVGSG